MGAVGSNIRKHKVVVLYEKPNINSKIIGHLHSTKRIRRRLRIANLKVAKGYLQGKENPWCYVYELNRNLEGWTKDIRPEIMDRKVNFLRNYIRPHLKPNDIKQLQGVWVQKLKPDKYSDKVPYYPGKNFNYVSYRQSFTVAGPQTNALYLKYNNGYFWVQYFDQITGDKHIVHYISKVRKNEYEFYVKGTYYGTLNGQIKVTGNKLKLRLRYQKKPTSSDPFVDFSGQYYRVTDSNFILKNYPKNQFKKFDGSPPPRLLKKIKESQVMMYEKTSKKSKVIRKLKKGEILERLGRGKFPLKFETFNGKKKAWSLYETKDHVDGYIWGGDIQNLIWSVKVPKMALHEKPNQKSKKLEIIRQYKYIRLIKKTPTQATINGHKDYWWFVKSIKTGKTGYIFSAFVKR